MRVLRLGFYWLLFPALMLVTFVVFLLFSSPGARLVATVAESLLPQLTISGLNGNIAYGLNAENIRWQQSEVTVELNGFATVWNPACVLQAHFCVRSVAAGELHISVAEGEPSPPATEPFSSLDLPFLVLPWNLQLDHFYLGQIAVTAGGRVTQLGPVSLQAEWSGSKVTLHQLQASMLDETIGAISATLSGVLEMRSEWPLSITLDGEYTPPLNDWQVQKLKLEGKGNLRDLHLDAKVLASLQIPHVGSLELDARAATHLLDSDVQINSLKGYWQQAPLYAGGGVSITQWGVITFRQLITRWGENEARLNGVMDQRWNVQGSLALAQPELLAADAQGRFDGKIALSGPRDDPLVSVELASAALKLFDVKLQQLEVNAALAPVSFSRMQVSARIQKLEYGEQSMENFNLQLEGDAKAHQMLASGTSHGYKLETAISGTLDTERWDWQGDIASLVLQLNHSWTLQLEQSAHVQWHNHDQRLQVDKSCFHDTEARICVGADQWLARQKGDLQLDIQHFSLEKLQPWLADQMLPQGEVNASLNISQQWLQPFVKGDIRVGNLSLQNPAEQQPLLRQGEIEAQFSGFEVVVSSQLEMPLGLRWNPVGPMTIRWKDTDASMQRSCWQGLRLATESLPDAVLGQLCIALTASKSQGVHASADLDLTVSEALQPWLPDGLDVDGQLTLNADAVLKGRTLNANLSAQISDGTLWLDQVESAQPLALPFERLQVTATLKDEKLDTRLELRSAHLGNGQAHALVDVRTKDPALSLEAQLNGFNLSVLRPLVPQISELNGTINVNLNAAGPLRRPDITGEVALENLALQSALVPLGIDDLDAKLTFNGKQGQLSGNLVSGTGKAEIDGELQLTDTGWNSRVHLLGHDIPVVQKPDIQLLIQPDFTLLADSKRIRLEGRLKISDGFLVFTPLPGDALATSNDVVFVDQRGTLLAQATHMEFSTDVSITIDKAVRFRGYGGEVQLEGTLRATQDANGIMLGRGRYDIVEGSYTGYGQNLKIRKGQILFNGPIDQPYINLEAVREVDTVVAGLRLTGPVSEPVATLFSEPSLPDSQILYYIITGKAPGTGTTDDNTMVQNALLSLSLQRGQPLARDIASKVGIDDLQMGTAGSGDDTEVTVSGYLNSRTFLQYGISVFQPVNTLTVRYRLRDNLFLEAVSGIAGALDLLYSFEF